MAAEPRACPGCAALGRAVSTTTLRSLVTRASAHDWAQAWYCASPGCEVVYFTDDGQRVGEGEVQVAVFHKREDPSRPVCYCFGHSVADVLAAETEDGGNRVVEAITLACRGGQDRCEETNPQGRCCLANVRGLVRRAAPSSGCCGGDG